MESKSKYFFFKFQNFLKFPSSALKKRNSSTTSTEERTIHQELNRHSIWDRTFGQAFSWLNKPIENDKDSYEIGEYNESNGKSQVDEQLSSSSQSSSLNAHLTYVTLKLQIIMQDVLEAKHKSLLTA